MFRGKGTKEDALDSLPSLKEVLIAGGYTSLYERVEAAVRDGSGDVPDIIDSIGNVAHIVDTVVTLPIVEYLSTFLDETSNFTGFSKYINAMLGASLSSDSDSDLCEEEEDSRGMTKEKIYAICVAVPELAVIFTHDSDSDDGISSDDAVVDM